MTKQICRVLQDQDVSLSLRMHLADAALEYANTLFAYTDAQVSRDNLDHAIALDTLKQSIWDIINNRTPNN